MFLDETYVSYKVQQSIPTDKILIPKERLYHKKEKGFNSSNVRFNSDK